MPARRLTHNLLRQSINALIVRHVYTPQKWCHSARLSQRLDTRAFHSGVASLATQQQSREPPFGFDQDDGGEAVLVQREPSISVPLLQRLRHPKRRKGHVGRVSPKHKKNKITSEGGNEQDVNNSPAEVNAVWRAKQTGELEEQLQRAAHHDPSLRVITNLLKVLIVHRSVKPTVSHFEALILANSDAELGSAKAVKAVLQEMEREQVAIGTSVYEAALKACLPHFVTKQFGGADSMQVLAVHPDYVFRASILDSMAKQWMSLTPSMEHSVTAGWIREGQLELAMQGIERMHQQKTPNETWLYGLMIYSLCAVEDFDAVLRLLYFAEDERVDIPTYTLHHILDRASECLNLDLTKRIWRDMVEPMYIIPSTGISYNVLLTAARCGDTALADSVTKVLSHRQSKPSELEYDLLEQTFVKAGDKGGAEKVRLRREQTEVPIRYTRIT